MALHLFTQLVFVLHDYFFSALLFSMLSSFISSSKPSIFLHCLAIHLCSTSSFSTSNLIHSMTRKLTHGSLKHIDLKMVMRFASISS